MICYNKIITWYTTLGSGPRYMICVPLFCTLHTANAQVKTHTAMQESHVRRVWFSNEAFLKENIHDLIICVLMSVLYL